MGRCGINDQTGDTEANRYLNTKSKEGQEATGAAHPGHIREETGGSGRRDEQDIAAHTSSAGRWPL